MTFADVVSECAENQELVKEFNRLYGCNFGKSLNRKPIEIMVDRACGVSGEDPEDMGKFVAFVFDCVWLRLPREAFTTAS